MTPEERARLLELSRAAKRIVEDPIFEKIVTHILAKQISVFQTAELDSLTARTAHATVRALELVKQEFTALASESVILEKEIKRNG
jgi:hypothetical protein